MSDGLLTRVPPQNLEAEQSVLGAVLLDNECMDLFVGWLPPDAFYRDAHRDIYRAMLELSDAREPIDAITLANRLRGGGKLEAIGGAEYIAELSNTVPTAAHAAHYARIVFEKSMLRNVAATAAAVASEAYDTPADVPEFLDDAARRISQVTDTSARIEVVDSSFAVKRALMLAEAAYERGGQVTGLPTGLIDLDKLTAGLHSGDLTVIAARPSRGKTALGINICADVCYNTGKNALFFSLEMSKEQLGARLLCGEARLNLLNFRSGFLSQKDFPLLAKATTAIAEAKGRLLINDESSLTPLAVKAIARREHRKHQLSLIVIDYIGLMSPPRHRDNREREVADISKALKGLAKELQLPVIALAQLNRNTESRAGGRPTLADLRESGTIEQDADNVIFIHDPEAYKPDDQRDRNAPRELILAKQRNGPTGTVKVTWLDEFARFENYAGGVE